MKRTILLTDEKVREVYDQIIEIQKKANPFIDRWNEIDDKKQELKKPYVDYIAEVENEEKELRTKLDSINQEAEALKEKLAPFLRNEIEPQLEDTEEFASLEVVDGQLYANIYDAVEQFKENFITKRLEQKVASKA